MNFLHYLMILSYLLDYLKTSNMSSMINKATRKTSASEIIVQNQGHIILHRSHVKVFNKNRTNIFFVL